MMRRALRWQHGVPVAVIILVVAVANAPYLSGVFNPNPINLDSGLAAITHAGLLIGLPVTDPNAGFNAQSLGHLVALDWLHGHIPWWNPYEGLGSPLAGEMQSGAFFPGTLLLYFANGQVYLHALLELVGGVATYFLLVEMRLVRSAAVAGAVMFALCGTFAWFGHSAAAPIAFLPVMLLGIERAANGRPRGWVLLAIGLALSLYAGFPETAYVDGLLAATWVVARAIVAPTGAERRRFLLAVAAGLGTGVLLSAPILCAFADYLAVGNLGPHAGLYGTLSLTRRSLPQLFLPYIYGPIDAFNGHDPTGTLTNVWLNAGGYVGLPVVVLGTIGACSRRHRWLVVTLGAFIVIALGRTFGIDVLTPLVNLLPGMKKVEFYRYTQPTLAMAGLVLASIGLDRITRATRPQLVVAGAAGVLVLGGSILEARGLVHDLAGTAGHWADASVAWALFVVLALVVAAWTLRGARRQFVLTILVVVDALGLFVIPELSAPRSATLYPAPATYLAAHLGTGRFDAVGPPLAPNYGSYFGVDSLSVDDTPTPKNYQTYLASVLGNPPGPFATATAGATALLEHLRAFEQAGVSYLVTPGDFTLPSLPAAASLHLVFSGPSADIFSLPHPSPFYEAAGCRLSGVGSGSVRTSCAAATTLVRREDSMAGWSATVDGRAVPVQADGVFEQVAVPRGNSLVIFSFEPPYMTLAVAAFLAGLAVLVGVSFVAARVRVAKGA